MTNFIKSISVFIFLLFVVSGVFAHSNYVILLDLSDRITVKGQIEQDKAVINAIFNKFYQDVKKDLFMKSSASFRVVIAPQSFVSYDKNQFESELIIDLSGINPMHRKKQLDVFKVNLTSRINTLYQTAHTSNNKKQYAGCDIWKYFNDYLQSDLKQKFENKLYILTDGYFDFENNPDVKKDGNKSTSTNFLNSLKHKNWKLEIETKGYGLIPICKNWFNTEVCVIGINPKSTNLDEIEKLKYIWARWLLESKFKVGKFILSTNSIKVISQL